MTKTTELNQKQRDMLLNLLWNFMQKDPDHEDRRTTGWGTKTRDGLVACIERIAFQEGKTI